MRAVMSAIRIATLLPVTIDVDMCAKRLDTLMWRSVVSVLGWIVVGIVPLVSFDAGGGQTAVEVLRYIVFRGLDRDAWYVISAASMIADALSASAVLFGLVLHTMGLVSRDPRLSVCGGGLILVGLLIMVVATLPVAAFSLFGLVVLPHVGWWLTLSYTAFTLWLLRQGSSQSMSGLL